MCCIFLMSYFVNHEFFEDQKETLSSKSENLDVLNALSSRQLKSVISMIKEFLC